MSQADRDYYWITKDGRQIPIHEMEDRHLLNAYKRSRDASLQQEIIIRLFTDKVYKPKPHDAYVDIHD
jgi:hypothetical protein